ncbi:hypothetical protein BDZ89DRAFT_1072484 [Hymenopellis radicata]|nr:hypothetical protein BDZ89DRAFT_1072484 [Hymenopellis radicata]
MAVQSTFKSCSPCEGSFTSYDQHLPIVVIPKGTTPFKFINTKDFDRPDFVCDPQSGEISVASKNLSADDDIPLSTFISCGILPRIRKRAPESIGAVAVALSTGCPFSGLPTELKILIFQYACDGMEYWLTALTLSLVSREWRGIAHALPNLWSHIAVDVPTVKRTGCWTPWRAFEIVWWYLHLAGEARLSVKVDLFAMDGDMEFEWAAKLLAQKAARWRQADIRCAPEDLCSFKEIKVSGLPMLKTLKFNVEDGLGKRCKAFRNAPKLEEHSPGGVSPRICVVGWNKLKTVILMDFFDCALYEYLEDASAMKELVIDADCFFETAFGGGIFIPLSASTLTMRSVPRLMYTFMEVFVFPALTTVDISIPDGSAMDSRFIPSFLSMLKHSGCSIRALKLHNVPLSDESLLDILTCTPKLRTLAIHEPAQEHCITEALLRNLSTVLLPKLRKLELVWSYDGGENRVLSMVESRIGQADTGVKGLQSIVLGRRFGLNLSASSVARMSMLRAAGVNITQW